jgi:hypothetical protein
MAPIIATCPRNERLRTSVGISRIATPTCERSVVSKTPIRRSPTLPRLLTPVYQMNGSDLVGKSRFAIPCDMIFVCPNTPIPRFPTLSQVLTRVRNDGRSLSPLAVSGFRTSRFRNAKVSCPRNPRYVDSRFSDGFLMVATCPTDGRL